MYTGNTISLKAILWRVMSNSMYSDLTYEDAGEFAIEAIKLMGSPVIHQEKVTKPIFVKNFKIATPDNMIEIRGVRKIENLDNYDDCAIAILPATDIYHNGENCEESEKDNCPDEYTYTYENGVMKFSFKEGNVQLSYRSLNTDKDGFPLIPHNQKVRMAIEYYIRYRYMEPLWEAGKVTDKVFNRLEQRKDWYMGGANTSLTIKNMDHVEAIGNTINRLIINTNAHKNFFKRMGDKERFHRYN